jgi:hypothetical protein
MGPYIRPVKMRRELGLTADSNFCPAASGKKKTPQGGVFRVVLMRGNQSVP